MESLRGNLQTQLDALQQRSDRADEEQVRTAALFFIIGICSTGHGTELDA